MALQFLQRANKLDISSPYKPESHTKPHSSDEDIVEDLLDDLQDVSDSLSHKIDSAIDKNLISDSSNALLKDISSGVVSLVGAIILLHKENDAQYLELHKNHRNNRQFDQSLVCASNSLKKKCDELTQKNRELTVQIFNLEEEYLASQNERVDILKQTKNLGKSLD